MTSISSKIASKSLTRLIFLGRTPLCRSLSSSTPTTAEARTQKLERIADELLSLNKLELLDYTILFRHKMGLNKYGPTISGLDSSMASSSASGSGSVETKAAEKTAFDVKLEKYDAAVKIKIIKEVRTFTDLGLKEAKDLVEKAPIVVKKGVTKEEANTILEKLKALGATVVRRNGNKVAHQLARHAKFHIHKGFISFRVGNFQFLFDCIVDFLSIWPNAISDLADALLTMDKNESKLPFF